MKNEMKNKKNLRDGNKVSEIVVKKFDIVLHSTVLLAGLLAMGSVMISSKCNIDKETREKAEEIELINATSKEYDLVNFCIDRLSDHKISDERIKFIAFNGNHSQLVIAYEKVYTAYMDGYLGSEQYISYLETLSERYDMAQLCDYDFLRKLMNPIIKYNSYSNHILTGEIMSINKEHLKPKYINVEVNGRTIRRNKLNLVWMFPNNQVMLKKKAEVIEKHFIRKYGSTFLKERLEQKSDNLTKEKYLLHLLREEFGFWNPKIILSPYDAPDNIDERYSRIIDLVPDLLDDGLLDLDRTFFGRSTYEFLVSLYCPEIDSIIISHPSFELNEKRVKETVRTGNINAFRLLEAKGLNQKYIQENVNKGKPWLDFCGTFTLRRYNLPISSSFEDDDERYRKSILRELYKKRFKELRFYLQTNYGAKTIKEIECEEKEKKLEQKLNSYSKYHPLPLKNDLEIRTKMFTKKQRVRAKATTPNGHKFQRQFMRV